AHLLNGGIIEKLEPIALWEILLDKVGVEGFQVGEADKLGDIGVVANIAFAIRVFIAPLFGGLTEEGHVEQVRFVGVDEADLLRGQLGGDEVFLNGVGMNAVVDLGQLAANI